MTPPPGGAKHQTPSSLPWIVILTVALVLRLPLAGFEMFHHPDEVWQYLEPAHGILTGRRVIPWEYRAGIRTWLIPTLLTGPMWIGRTFLPAAYLLPVRVTLILLSLVVVLFGGLIAARVSRLHGLIVAACLAASTELVYFSGRALSDSLALVTVLPALWLMGRDRPVRRDWLLAGALLGLSFTIRFQLAPALGVAALMGARGDIRRWTALIAGALAALVGAAAADVANGATPLVWIVRNVVQNIVVNRSASYGVEPAWWYVTNQVALWGWAGIVLIPAILAGIRRAPGLAVIACVNIAAHSLIGHKEYRFVLLSSTLFTILAGIGLADGVSLLGAPRRRWALAGLALLWIGCSVAIAASPAGRRQWLFGRRTVQSLRAAASQPGSCGLAIVTRESLLAGAYTYYDRAAPIYAFKSPRELQYVRSQTDRFNVVLAPQAAQGALTTRFRFVTCYATAEERAAGASPERCLFIRAGECAAPARSPFEINAALRRSGE